MAPLTASRDEDHITAAPHADLDEKADIKHVEDSEDEVIMKSPFEDLPIKKTWIIFHKVALMCLFAAFSAAAE